MDVGPAVTSSSLPQGRVGRTFPAAAPRPSWQPDQGLRLPVPGVDTPGRWCLPSWGDGSYRARGLALTAECVPRTLLGNGLQSGPKEVQTGHLEQSGRAASLLPCAAVKTNLGRRSGLVVSPRLAAATETRFWDPSTPSLKTPKVLAGGPWLPETPQLAINERQIRPGPPVPGVYR